MRATALLGLDRAAEAARAARAGLDVATAEYGEQHHPVRTLRTLLAQAEASGG